MWRGLVEEWDHPETLAPRVSLAPLVQVEVQASRVFQVYRENRVQKEMKDRRVRLEPLASQGTMERQATSDIQGNQGEGVPLDQRVLQAKTACLVVTESPGKMVPLEFQGTKVNLEYLASRAQKEIVV